MAMTIVSEMVMFEPLIRAWAITALPTKRNYICCGSNYIPCCRCKGKGMEDYVRGRSQMTDLLLPVIAAPQLWLSQCQTPWICTDRIVRAYVDPYLHTIICSTMD